MRISTKKSVSKKGSPGTSRIELWFKQRGWSPASFQKDAWNAWLDGKDGIIQVPTGSGKTYAAFGGPLAAMLDGEVTHQGLQVLYVTPLRALARDIEAALNDIVAGTGLEATIGSRTGDTSEKVRAQQRKKMPTILVITPESLCLLLARSDASALFANLRAVIVDEWHELLASKRGVQMQLCLSRLRALSSQERGLRTWGLSATIGNVQHAMKALMPADVTGFLVRSDLARPIILDTILPNLIDPFPWAGHMGLSMLPKILEAIDPSESNLIFTNTRRQAEAWFQALKEQRPDWSELIALHHGSLSLENREQVEAGLKDGRLRIVVATSALDLGVDFPYVERVFQIGSPKAVARLTQRAGRSAHRPGAACRATCIPTNTFEIVEFVAARAAVARGEVEERVSREGDLDVLIQHLITLAIGGGFAADQVFREIRNTWAYKDLSREDYNWCLRFIVDGGHVLNAYPAYKKAQEADGFYAMTDRRQCAIHRLNIGTIASDEQIQLKLLKGSRLGSVDESYIEKLKKGDRFIFGGRVLEYLSLYELTARVKAATGKKANIPAFQGIIQPMSLQLGQEVMRLLSDEDSFLMLADSQEKAAFSQVIAMQRQVSTVPEKGEYLFETWKDGRDSCLFCFPFAGRAAHEGIAALLALRLSRKHKATFAVTVNDYGFMLARMGGDFDFHSAVKNDLFTTDDLTEDLAETVDAGQIAKRKFREIARISGIVPQRYPGNQRKGGRALHVSSSLLHDTLARFDPDNLLVRQARADAVSELLAGGKVAAVLNQLRGSDWRWVTMRRPSPFSFPLVVERVRARLGSESLSERIEQMKASWMTPDRHERKKRGGHTIDTGH